MKVVIISNDFRVYWKGRLTYLQQLLVKRNVAFNVIELFGKGSPYAFDNLTRHFEWWQCLFPDKSAAQLSNTQIEQALFSALDEAQPDIIIASPITFFAGALGLRWAKRNKKKYIMFDDAKPLAQFKRNALVQGVKNMLIKQADALWLPAKDYNDAYPFLNKKDVLFFYGYSCIDNNFFAGNKKKYPADNTIICVARLVPVKNIENLLQAWGLVEKQNSNYTLQIFGDGPLYEPLVKLSKALNLVHVQFMGAIAYNKLPPAYHHADAFILPSLSETWGLVVNEAMAAGLPVLLSEKVNAAHSLLKEGINGFGFDPYNANSIAEAILKFINSTTELKESMSVQSLKIIEYMDYNSMGTQLLTALNQIKDKKFKRPGLLAKTIISFWDGKHNTSAWDKINA